MEFVMHFETLESNLTILLYNVKNLASFSGGNQGKKQQPCYRSIKKA
jgi:hypothetical protein